MSLKVSGRRRVGVAAMSVLLGIVGCALAWPANAEPIPTQERVLEGEGTFDVINPCTGETVVLTGSTYRYQAGVFFTDGTGMFVSATRFVTTATGTGVDTGASYQFRSQTVNPSHQSGTASTGGLISMTQRLTSQGSTDNFYAVITTFILYDANNVSRVNYLVEDSGCTG